MLKKKDSGLYGCPLELDLLCGAPRETALLAAVRGGYADVVSLLLQNGADPNVIAKPMDEYRLNYFLLFFVILKLGMVCYKCTKIGRNKWHIVFAEKNR